MRYEYDDDRLTIYADDVERAELAELTNKELVADKAMYELFEDLVANSELTWLNPCDTGDLTEAPMLGILGDESIEDVGPFGAMHVGRWDGKDQYQPILQRWGYMEYAVRSPLEDLLETGECVFVSSN